MREEFQRELNELAEQLADLAELAENAMTDATRALLDTDLDAALRVETAVDTIHNRHHELDEHAVAVLARQQPVATDLRTLVAGLRISADLERMGILASHVAEIVRERHPRAVIPPQLRDTVVAMVNAAQDIIAKARNVIVTRDPDVAIDLEVEDDLMDKLKDTLYRELLKESWHPDVATAVDVTLIGRYYERYADHAVSIARRVAFLTSGHLPDQAMSHRPY